MYVGSMSGGGLASVQSTLSYALARRSSLRTPRNFLHAQKFSAYADVRPVRSEHAMHMLCERSALARRGRRTLTERPQFLTLVDTKCDNFTTSPLRVGHFSHLRNHLIYFETGWEKLKDRRERRKLCTLHKIYHNAAPDYLTEILESYSITNPYNLRRVTDFNIPRYRLNTTINSFYPSTVHSWNNTNPDIRHNPSLNHFKSYLKSQNHDVIIPRFLLYGERRLNVLQTRIRCISSNLNPDLFRVNLTNSPLCQCGNYLEDSYHFFLECRMYHPQRLKLFQTLSNYHPINADLLLFGNTTLTDEENEIIMLVTQNLHKGQ